MRAAGRFVMKARGRINALHKADGTPPDEYVRERPRRHPGDPLG